MGIQRSEYQVVRDNPDGSTTKLGSTYRKLSDAISHKKAVNMGFPEYSLGILKRVVDVSDWVRLGS